MNLKIFSLLAVLMSFFNQNFADNMQIVTIDSPLQHVLEDAVVMDFTNREEMLDFMKQVKKDDSLRYKRPN